MDDWKIHFKIMEGNLASAVLKPLNMPQVINLRQDPFERFPSESAMYFRWWADKSNSIPNGRESIDNSAAEPGRQRGEGERDRQGD